MIGGIGSDRNQFPSSLPQIPAERDKGTKELTTVTTHCNKNHWHTPDCPHTTFTRPADEAQRRGEYIDLYV